MHLLESVSAAETSPCDSASGSDTSVSCICSASLLPVSVQDTNCCVQAGAGTVMDNKKNRACNCLGASSVASSVDAAALLKRSHEIQLKQKKNPYGSKAKTQSVTVSWRSLDYVCVRKLYFMYQVSMSKMRRTKTGSYVRDGMAVEVVAASTYTYSDMLEQGCAALNLDRSCLGMVLHLFNMSGAMIPQSEEWTIGGYLRRMKKKEVKFGIGYVEVT